MRSTLQALGLPGLSYLLLPPLLFTWLLFTCSSPQGPCLLCPQPPMGTKGTAVWVAAYSSILTNCDCHLLPPHSPLKQHKDNLSSGQPWEAGRPSLKAFICKRGNWWASVVKELAEVTTVARAQMLSLGVLVSPLPFGVVMVLLCDSGPLLSLFVFHLGLPW